MCRLTVLWYALSNITLLIYKPKDEPFTNGSIAVLLVNN